MAETNPVFIPRPVPIVRPAAQVPPEFAEEPMLPPEFEEAPPTKKGGDMSDVLGLSAEEEAEVLGVTDADVTGETEEEDLSDVLEISPEDEAEILGTEPAQPRKPRIVNPARFRRTNVQYPGGIGGVRL